MKTTMNIQETIGCNISSNIFGRGLVAANGAEFVIKVRGDGPCVVTNNTYWRVQNGGVPNEGPLLEYDYTNRGALMFTGNVINGPQTNISYYTVNNVNGATGPNIKVDNLLFKRIMIIYPPKPWVNGQTFEHTTADDEIIIGMYDGQNNTWLFRPKTTGDLVFTNTVYTVDVKPADASIARAGQLFNDALPLPGVDNLVTQQDVNWYLYDLINSIDGGSQIWVDINEPPGTDNDNPITKFWWKDDEEQLYVWDTIAVEWKLTGLMDFDRPPNL